MRFSSTRMGISEDIQPIRARHLMTNLLNWHVTIIENHWKASCSNNIALVVGILHSGLFFSPIILFSSRSNELFPSFRPRKSSFWFFQIFKLWKALKRRGRGKGSPMNRTGVPFQVQIAVVYRLEKSCLIHIIFAFSSGESSSPGFCFTSWINALSVSFSDFGLAKQQAFEAVRKIICCFSPLS